MNSEHSAETEAGTPSTHACCNLPTLEHMTTCHFCDARGDALDTATYGEPVCRTCVTLSADPDPDPDPFTGLDDDLHHGPRAPLKSLAQLADELDAVAQLLITSIDAVRESLTR